MSDKEPPEPIQRHDHLEDAWSAGPGMGQPVEKAKDFRGTIKRLSQYLSAGKIPLYAGIFPGGSQHPIFHSGSQNYGQGHHQIGEGVLAKYAYFLQLNAAIQNKMPITYINQLKKQPIPSFDFGYIGKILLMLIVLYIISALFSYIMAYIMASVSQETVYKMRNDVKDKLDRLPLKYFDQRTHGEILSRVTNDMDNIATTLQQSLTQLITSFVTVMGILIMMLTISPLHDPDCPGNPSGQCGSYGLNCFKIHRSILPNSRNVLGN